MYEKLKRKHSKAAEGIVSNKLHEIDSLMYSSSPHILGLGETVMDQAAVDILTTEGFNVETKDDNERISVIIRNNINYRRSDLETALQPVVWLEFGTGGQKHLIGHYYREWKVPQHRKNTTQ